MGIHRLPEYTDYWSTDRLLGVQAVKDTMPFNRFKSLRRYLHCDDNTCIVDSKKITSKIHIVLETLSTNYLAKYHPSQELSVDEMMIKYKGRKGGKIHMPRKPVKLGFKVWCCSCSCCGYLCTFDVYSGLNLGNPPSQDIRVSVSRVGLSRGRCQICVQDRIPSKEQKHTAMACPNCTIRICHEHAIIGHRCSKLD